MKPTARKINAVITSVIKRYGSRHFAVSTGLTPADADGIIILSLKGEDKSPNCAPETHAPIHSVSGAPVAMAKGRPIGKIMTADAVREPVA